MPRGKKSQKNGPGWALVKQMEKDKRSKSNDYQVHRDKQPNINNALDSVTELTDMADFLSRMDISKTREQESQAHTVRLLSSTAVHGIFSSEELKEMSIAQKKHTKELRIPRKPHWEKTSTKQELNETQDAAFTEWRMNLSKIEKLDNLKLTPYEKNVEVWKQLWRVVERSDVVVQIVDARNPLMFRCCDLENYIKEVDSTKINLLLVNKSDFLTDTQRELWTQYFTKNNVYAVFFSALAETPNFPSEQDNNLSTVDECEELNNSNVSEEPESIDNDIEEGNGNYSDNEDVDVETSSIVTDSNNYETANEQLPEDFDDDSFETDCSEDFDEESEICSSIHTEENNSKEKVIENYQPDLVTISKVYNREELLDLFASLCPKRESVATIGLVGYPNVGKSSTINCLMQDKKVTVSATPGKTKHFQTLYVRPDLILCDCPGLVFPGFVTSRQEMVMWGILPIDRMKRENESSVTLLCSIIPPPALEACYNLTLPGGQGRAPTPEEFLSAHALTRSFMSAAGRPDVSRSARDVLKDFMNGRLLHCIAPPGFDQSSYHTHNTERKTKNKMKLTPKQRVFMPETPEDVRAYMNQLSFGVPLEQHVELKGKKARKQRRKMPKGFVDTSEGPDGVEVTVTKPWKNAPKERRQGKKNPNTNNPYGDSYW